MFDKLKHALAHILGLGETDAHTLVTAIEADAKPLLDAFRKQLADDVTAAAAAGKVDLEALAKAVAAEVVKLLPAQTPAVGQS